MKAHTSSFKEQIKLIGKEIDSRITFGSTVLGKNDLNAVTSSYQGAILKSVMKQLDIDSNVAIPIGTILKYEFGLKVNGEYEYIDYGNYVVYRVEKQEDTKSYKITCYDKLLYSMLDYVKLPITYPISIRDYINAISTVLGLTFANNNDTFANYDKQIQSDLYDGLGYTFRDVLDELAQVTASTICLNNNDELEIRYITETGDTIDEEFLKDVNVNFGEKFGAVNTIVLSRSAGSDNIYYPEVLPSKPYEIKISDNQIMNGNDRADFLPDIYNKLNGLEFYTNDFVSTGICYYDLCDRYSVKVGDNTYSCVMFNDEVLVTQGLEENVYTELPEQTETDYKKADTTDRRINQAYAILDKQNKEFEVLVSEVNSNEEKIGSLEITTGNISASVESIDKQIIPTASVSGSNIYVDDASDDPLIQLEIEGKSTQKTRSGINQLMSFEAGETSYFSGISNNSNSATEYWKAEPLEDNWIHVECDLTGRTTTTESYLNFFISLDKLPNLKTSNTYTLVFEFRNVNITTMQSSLNLAQTHTGTGDNVFKGSFGVSMATISIGETLKYLTTTFDTFASDTLIALRNFHTIRLGDKFSYDIRISVLEGDYTNKEYTYEAYGASPSPDYPSEIESVGYENLFDISKTTFGSLGNSSGNYNSTGATGSIVDNTISMTTTATYKGAVSDYIEVEQNSDYTLNYLKNTTLTMFNIAYYYDENKTFLGYSSGNGATLPRVFITPNNAKYIRFVIETTTAGDTTLSNIVFYKGVKKHSYIPYGKYGIEVESSSKNLYNATLEKVVVNELTRYADTKQIYLDGTPTAENRYMFGGTTLPIGTYTLCLELDKGTMSDFGFYIYKNTSWTTITSIILSSSNNFKNYATFTLEEETTIYLAAYMGNYQTCSNAYINYQVVSGQNADYDFQSYQKSTSLIVLNEPLRSLPNGVKDIAYIKNNKLYVDRYVGNVVLNGSEEWLFEASTTTPTNRSVIRRYFVSSKNNVWLSNRFIMSSTDGNVLTVRTDVIYLSLQDKLTGILSTDDNATKISKCTEYLSTHNVQLDYELATPITEELSEIQMPSTFKSVNHITTTDELEPTINIEYVRDTTLSNYVEGQINKVMTIEERHYSELVIEDNSIKESVESVNSSLNGLNTTINRVEEITTDNSQVINIISTNIDKTSGEVKEVTTTTGFTFNADGMTIDDGSGFKAEHTAEGTYYKDGNSIVGQYTKDGSKQKDLELFGTYSYGKESINDTPMFVGQLYTDENGEQGFGHFYNGEG